MLFHVLIFLIFQSVSENIVWNPCPSLRSTFQDITVDNQGRKYPNCVCKNDLFGDRCQFKVYISFDGKQNGFQQNSPELSIYPLEHLNLNHYPNNSLVLSWRHVKIVDVYYYVIQFRDLINEKSWRTLAYITSFQDLMLFELHNFYNYTIYEVNLGVFSKDDVIVSVSVLRDTWRQELFQDILLYDVMFSTSITSWSPWGSCETQNGCGKGKQKRSNVLVTNHCLSKKNEETRSCKLQSCPVNGGWSVWSLWSQCYCGMRSKIRSCTSPPPRHDGEMCHGLHQMNETCTNETCGESSTIATWSPLNKLKSLDFTSLILGIAAGFTSCLLMIASPHLLKRCARSLREKYKSLKDKNFAKAPKILLFNPQQTALNHPVSPPIPPPPPVMNWRPIPVQHVLPSLPQPAQPSQRVWTQTTQHMANNLFMDELLKAFKAFNVDSNKQFGKLSDKQPP